MSDKSAMDQGFGSTWITDDAVFDAIPIGISFRLTTSNLSGVEIPTEEEWHSFKDVESSPSVIIQWFRVSSLIFITAAFMLIRSHEANRDQRSRSIPGPRWYIPSIGSLTFIRRRWFDTLADLRGRYGDVYKLRIGSLDVVVLNGLETVRRALVGDGSDEGKHGARMLAGRPDLHTFQLASRGKSMSFNSYSPEWCRHRRLAERAMRTMNNKEEFWRTVVAEEVRKLVEIFVGQHSAVAYDPWEDVLWSVARVKYGLCYGGVDQVERGEPIDQVEGRRSMDQVEGGGSMNQVERGGSMDQAQGRGSMAQVEEGGSMAQVEEGGSMAQVDEGGSMNQVEGKGPTPAGEDFKAMITNTLNLIDCHSRGNVVDFFPWARRLFSRQEETLKQVCAEMLEVTERKHVEHMDTYCPDRVRDIQDALIKHGIYGDCALQDIDQVVMTVQEYIGAGLDIVYAALMWTLLYVTKFPEVQRRVQAEVDAVVGRVRQPSAADVPRLPYTEAVVLEVLRHASVVPLALPHCATEDTHLNGIPIPRGVFLMVNLHSINHDPAVWDQPESFSPERFLVRNEVGEVGVRRDRCYQFGLGKRRCIGEEFSRVELVMYLSGMLQRCTLGQPEGCSRGDGYGLEPRLGIVLKPRAFAVAVRPR